MNPVRLSEVEEMVLQLSHEEQLWLAERIIHFLKHGTPQDKSRSEKQIGMMAEDLEIQKEIKNIENEFMITESDGLENL